MQRPADAAIPVHDGERVVPTTVGMRRMLVIAGVFVIIAGFQLFVGSTRTADYFAWTIDPPLTAAFLGAGYWSSAILELGSARRREWCRARCAMPTVLLFTAITLVVTLVHLDRFHLDSVFGIAWLAVYCVFPVAMTAALVFQLRVPGVDLERQRPLALWVRVLLGAQAALLAPFGVLLLLATSTAAAWWPWALTPLTARAVGAWLVGIAVLAVQMVVERSLDRVDIALSAYAAFGVLQLVAVARFADTPDWNAAGAVAYLGFCVSMIVVGAVGLVAIRRDLRATPSGVGAATAQP